MPKLITRGTHEVRVYTPDEVRERIERRKRGELKEPETPELLPADIDRKRKRFSITVPESVMKRARSLAGGNASRGIERAVDELYENRKRKR